MAFNVPALGGRIRNSRRSYSNRSIIVPWGIDVNKPNSYDQTALDIVTKSASSGGTGGKDLKRLLKACECCTCRFPETQSRAPEVQGEMVIPERDKSNTIAELTSFIKRTQKLCEKLYLLYRNNSQGEALLPGYIYMSCHNITLPLPLERQWSGGYRASYSPLSDE
ncbi:hypothetical protein RRG08_030887 [Elysia crispata]|uniref:Uncharacterized protein n=1 Tax=Elysia crispata TaxID=231223 RepID=A0AAE1CLT5_9GAST|nr:hypothetical protein RRG08_030887 [Elysia crispata]